MTTGPRPVTRPILLGLGESGIPEAAMSWAVAAAVAEGRGLKLIHVVAPQTGWPRLAEVHVDSALVRAAGKKLVANAAARARTLTDGRVEISTASPTGYTTDVLVALGDEVDRIVLGRHDLSRLQRVFTGSVVCSVAGRAVVPVVSVSDSWQPRRTERPRVTVGVDGDLSDPRLLHQAFKAAERLRGTLSVLHAWWLPSIYDDVVIDRAQLELWAVEAGRRIELGLDEWRQKYPDVPVDLEITHERPGDALVRASQSSDLLVIGRLGAGHHIPHLGPLTRAVIRESHCPVEIVPSGGHPHAASAVELKP